MRVSSQGGSVGVGMMGVILERTYGMYIFEMV